MQNSNNYVQLFALVHSPHLHVAKGVSPLETPDPRNNLAIYATLKNSKAIWGSRGTASVASRRLPEQCAEKGWGHRGKGKNTLINGNLSQFEKRGA